MKKDQDAQMRELLSKMRESLGLSAPVARGRAANRCPNDLLLN